MENASLGGVMPIARPVKLEECREGRRVVEAKRDV
jgi:hypothetical protein